MADDAAASTAVEQNAGDDDLAAVLKDAQNPDAVKNAIKRHQDAAAAAKQEAAEMRQKVEEFQNRDKTEQQKKDEAAAAADKRAATAESELLKFRVAAEKKLPIDLAEFLNGSSKEEIEAAADKLLERIGEQRPEPDFGSGARESAPAKGDMDAAIRRAAGR